MSRHEPSFAERQQASTAAKQAEIVKARALAEASAPGFAERQAERQRIAAAREAKKSERAAQKRADAIRAAEEKAATQLAKQREKEATEAANEARKVQLAAEALVLAAKQKAARDAKYAARKTRRSIRSGVR